MRTLEFLFQEPGLVEAIAFEPDDGSEEELITPGYRSVWVADLMIDYDPGTNKPYCFMSSSFEKTYPLVIWTLKFHMSDELFDVPQAGLTAVPLHEAFSWAYAHFILEDQLPTAGSGLAERGERPSLTRLVLRRALAAL